VEQPEEAQRIAKLSDEHFAAALEERLQGLLGTISDVGPRAIYPLSGLEAEHMGRNRVALVGEAARVIAPIGAQGLNLALRDVATLADYVADASASGGDVGGIELLRGYDRARAADAASRSVSVDLLNRSLLSDFVPLHALRGVGLHLLANIPAFRRFAMQRGLGPDATSLPRLMRPAVTG
jgi:2-octaprenyl-6-methoxyphenol hydroxylase